MEPVSPPEPVRLGISISPSGKMEPDWLDNPNRNPKAIFVTYEEFVTITNRLEDKLLRGTIVPSSEDENPGFFIENTSCFAKSWRDKMITTQPVVPER